MLLGGTLTLSQPLLVAESTNLALQALFDQAAYWHQKAHDDLAKASLQKVLQANPQDADALAGIGHGAAPANYMPVTSPARSR